MTAAGEPGQASDPGEVASGDVLRRLEAVGAAYAVAAGGAFALLAGWHRGVALTAAAAVSIVALRSLERVVGRLRADETDEVEESASLGWRYPLRLLLLAVLVILLVVGTRDLLALLLGLLAMPLALLCEAAFQLLTIRRQR
ncbi:MAG TPA: hypothetical protein VGV61_04510 [Thermoanaerobaculia bacterium]|jgi:hypothetical protein|nr:hypothetical protein [Thermoanaerobaculia bacterium]